MLGSIKTSLASWSSGGADGGVANPSGCLVGDYDCRSLCMPRNPFTKKPQAQPRFYEVRDKLPLLTAAAVGFQHAVAMVGGIIVPALIISSASADDSNRAYLVSASLIVSGLASIVQCYRFAIPHTKLYLGTGLLTVVGSGIQHVPICVSAIAQMMDQGESFETAYGKCLGTLLLCSLSVLAVSFLKPGTLARAFPPWVAGLTLFVTGVDLINVGLGNWGGGNGSCANSATALCSGNGDVHLVYGSAPYVALGAAVLLVIILIECFGSPFLRNIQIMVGFVVGYAIAAIATYDGKSFINQAQIQAAPGFQFLWMKSFKLGFYPAAVLPFIIAFLTNASCTVGLVTATEEASGLVTYGPEHSVRLQGGLLGDGLGSMFAALATTTPVLLFAQNVGIITLSMVASRVAGIVCGVWLILLGMAGKFGAFMAFAPSAVLGGLQTFVFGSVAVAGLRLMTMCKFDRRMRFIQVMAVALGLGITHNPRWARNALWRLPPGASPSLQAIHDSVIMVLGTGFSMAFVLAMLLHAILPEEQEPPSLRAAARKNAAHYESGSRAASPAAAAASDDSGTTGGMGSPGGGILVISAGGGYPDVSDRSRGKGKDTSKGEIMEGSIKGGDLVLTMLPATVSYAECGPEAAQSSDAGSSDSAAASAAVIIITDVESQVPEVTAAPAK